MQLSQCNLFATQENKDKKLNVINNTYAVKDFKYEIRNFYSYDSKDVCSYDIFVYILVYFIIYLIL